MICACRVIEYMCQSMLSLLQSNLCLVPQRMCTLYLAMSVHRRQCSKGVYPCVSKRDW